MRTLRIGLDLDGVIVDHTAHKMRVAKTLGFAVRENQTHEAILKQLMPEEKYRALQAKVYGSMSMSATPIISAKRTIRRLAREGHDLFIVSRRGENAQDALLWLKRHRVLDSVARRNITFVNADAGKAPAVKQYGIEIFLDDKPSVLDYLAAITHPVFFNNLKVNINSAQYTEVHSWEEFLNVVDKMST